MKRLAGKGKGLDRERAMKARPERLPVIRRQELPNGKMRVTVELGSPRWARWMTGRDRFERTFGLDRLGCEVYEACDGKTEVRRIIREFAESHKISMAEAEISVTAFLKTLLRKGLVAMGVERE